jgi:hypothetical protein
MGCKEFRRFYTLLKDPVDQIFGRFSAMIASQPQADISASLRLPHD